jgi:hypothetical protein
MQETWDCLPHLLTNPGCINKNPYEILKKIKKSYSKYKSYLRTLEKSIKWKLAT